MWPHASHAAVHQCSGALSETRSPLSFTLLSLYQPDGLTICPEHWPKTAHATCKPSIHLQLQSLFKVVRLFSYSEPHWVTYEVKQTFCYTDGLTSQVLHGGEEQLAYYFVKQFFSTISDTQAGVTIIEPSESSTECHLRDHLFYFHGGDGYIHAIT